MAHAHRDRVTASLRRSSFDRFGADAVYTPAGGIAVALKAIVSFGDEVPGDMFNTWQTGKLAALLAADVPGRPSRGDTLSIDGWGEFEIPEDALSFDKYQLIWTCRVVAA